MRRLAFGPEPRFATPFGMFVGTMRTTIKGGEAHEVQLFNAIIAAKTLSDALAHPGDHSTAFTAYEATHRRRLRPFQRRAGIARVSLRYVYVHLIREHPRHAGHADVLRELTDGSTGDPNVSSNAQGSR